jgi:hypothetical protein
MAGIRIRPATAGARTRPATDIPRATATDHINLVTATRPATDIPPVMATGRRTPTLAMTGTRRTTPTLRKLIPTRVDRNLRQPTRWNR